MNTVHDSSSHWVSCKRRRNWINKHSPCGNATPGDFLTLDNSGWGKFSSKLLPKCLFHKQRLQLLTNSTECSKQLPNFHGHSAADLTSHLLCCFFFFLLLGIMWNVNFSGIMWRLNWLSSNPLHCRPIRFTALFHYLQLSAINLNSW